MPVERHGICLERKKGGEEAHNFEAQKRNVEVEEA
jgi:hypothetical protein